LDDEIEDKDMKIVMGKDSVAPSPETTTKKPATFIFPTDESTLTDDSNSVIDNDGKNINDNGNNANTSNEPTATADIDSESDKSDNISQDQTISESKEPLQDGKIIPAAKQSQNNDIDEAFLSRLKRHPIDDDDDDFIVRKPGEPKK